ncbi:MmgE/PrpD family protein [Azospirillum melinis]
MSRTAPLASTAPAPAEPLSAAIARHAIATPFDRLPESATSAAITVALDTLAVAWAGTTAPGAVETRDHALDQGGKPEAEIWGHGARLPAASAAFVNGVAAAALDYDTVNIAAVVHSDIVVLPAVLAVAQREHASGRDFLAALTLGNDIAGRLARTTTAHSGWFYTSIHGIFAAAAASARLLGLSERQTVDALGIALSSVGGTQQPMAERSLTKRLQSAFAAEAGVRAALLAQRGISGPAGSIDGRFGLYALYEAGDPAPFHDRLGERFENDRFAFKKFPTCACGHAPTQAALDLAADHAIDPDEITAIRIALTPYSHRLVGAPFAPDPNPQVTAQFSVQYQVASALLRRRLGLAELEESAVRDPRIAALVARSSVEIRDEPGVNRLLPAEVTVVTARRGAFTRKVALLPGSPEAPLSDAELREKFADATGRGLRPLDPAARDRLHRRLTGIARLGDVADLFTGLQDSQRRDPQGDRA